MTPELEAKDLEETIRFYTERLGFDLAGAWPDDEPTLCFLDHGDVHLMFFTEGRPDERDGPALSGQLRFDVTNVAGLHARLAGQVEVLWGPEVYDYGRREFSIRDPNGYALVFSEPTEDPPDCVE